MTISIEGISGSVAYCEAMGLSKCFAAYAEHAGRAEIMAMGFNPDSGYVYIALESGPCIASMLGRDVVYIVTDNDTGEEQFFDSYEEASENE